jgi:hypothetical protein
MIDATVAIPETEAADAEGRVPPITAAAGPAVKTVVMSMPTPQAVATATASAKIGTRAATAQEEIAQEESAQEESAQEETGEEATGARGNGTVIGVAGVDGTAVMTGGSVARSAI